MHKYLLILGLLLLSGCAETGYQPAYIISCSVQDEEPPVVEDVSKR